jgi:hypothetical protein
VTRFLVVHGLQGSGPGHWQPWLAERLTAAGHDVRFPALPDADAPALAPWLEALAAERAPGGGEVVLCHSLGCLLWLHHRAAGGPPAERALLVAPPSLACGVAEVRPFFPVPITGEPRARFVCSDADPYCPEGAPALYDGPFDVVPGGGHLNADAGFGPWPAVEAWAYGAKNGVET